MKAYVEAGLATNAVKKCNANYQVDLLDKPKGEVVMRFNICLKEND